MNNFERLVAWLKGEPSAPSPTVCNYCCNTEHVYIFGSSGFKVCTKCLDKAIRTGLADKDNR